MPLKRMCKGTPVQVMAASGLLYHDLAALTPCQRECIIRFGMTVQLEQESYLNQHPEVQVMLDTFICKMAQKAKRKGIQSEAGKHFSRPFVEIDKEIRDILGLPATGPYIKGDKSAFVYEDMNLEADLISIIKKHYPPEPMKIPTPVILTPNTLSSSFLSLVTSDTTLPTPEPIPTPEPTISETFYALVSFTVDKAIYSHVDDRALRYDTAYVELSKAVEEAMEIPVIEVKDDIAELYFNAYKLFEIDIMEKERIAAEIAWERRMRKKMKRTLRRLNNFKGYETPPTPRSVVSSHDSYKKPPPKPCVCHPQINYNRYVKDRFGIYLPRDTEFRTGNTTATPAISIESIPETNQAEDDKADVKSILSKKSTTKGSKKVQV